MVDFGLQFAGVELYFEDLKRAKEFYGDFLGLEIEEDDPSHHAKFRLGGRFLCLEKKGVEDYPSVDKAVLFFEVADLAAFITQVGPQRMVQTGPASGLPRWAVLHDPEGHNILILQK
ncbi:MAG TPA: VOC family protein [Terriglobales bacterium]|nr:VOC family protein [Terriglobales bacterium]